MCKNIIIIITSTSVHLNKNVTFRTDRYESDRPVYFPTMAILTWKFDCAIVLDLNGHSLKSIRGNTLPLTLGTIRRIMTSESYRSLQIVKFGGPFCPFRQLRFPRYLSSTAYINRNKKETVDTSAYCSFKLRDEEKLQWSFKNTYYWSSKTFRIDSWAFWSYKKSSIVDG